MDGVFDAKAFVTGKYVLAVGPAISQDEAYPQLPVPSVGSAIELDGKSYEVMAVVYPLMPVDDGASEIGAPASMEMHFILPSETFLAQWPENTLRRLFVNVEDTHVDEMQEWLNTYTSDSERAEKALNELEKAFDMAYMEIKQKRAIHQALRNVSV